MYERYARCIVELYRNARGCVLVLTPCYEFASEIYKHITGS